MVPDNVRIHRSLASHRLCLLPTGTTSNEALHHEINRCYKETQKLHQASLQLKLEILQLGKLLSHNRALYHHTTKQGHVENPCGLPIRGAHGTLSYLMAKDLMKADLPKEDERSRQKAAVRGNVKRKPAAAVREKTRRTVFTLERQDSLVRGGKKNCRG